VRAVVKSHHADFGFALCYPRSTGPLEERRSRTRCARPLSPGASGNPARRFQPGVSGNPSDKPKSFSIHQLVAEAIDDNDTRAEAVRRVQENLKNRRTVLSTLELAARLNKEIASAPRIGRPG
jgi:hypothetical protein